MRQIDGVQIGNHVFRYGSKVFQTNSGTLLKFISDADQWEGVFPGCSWDRFYDEVIINLSVGHINQLAFKQRHVAPTIIQGANVGYCTQCSNKTSYKFCSVSCWFFNTIEMTRQTIAESESREKIDRHVAFIERMVMLFGKQVDEEQTNLVQFCGDADSTS